MYIAEIKNGHYANGMAVILAVGYKFGGHYGGVAAMERFNQE